MSAPPTPNQMLDWIALYVTEINTVLLNSGEVVEVCAADDDHAIVVSRRVETRRGPDYPKAFRQCVIAGMKQIKL